VREGFARTDRGIDDLRVEMRSGFARTDDRFDQLQRTLILGLIGLAGTLIASIAATVIALA
jgi:hypothetical protein